MFRATATPTMQVQANVEVLVHDADAARRVEPRFDSLSKEGKLGVLSYLPPEQVCREKNTTVDNLHGLIVDLLDPNTSRSDDVSHMAVGIGTSSPSRGDTALTNEVYRTPVTTTDDRGSRLFTSTLLDTGEANGNDLREMGLALSGTSGASDIVNHSLMELIEKDADSTATINCTLIISPA